MHRFIFVLVVTIGQVPAHNLLDAYLVWIEYPQPSQPVHYYYYPKPRQPWFHFDSTFSNSNQPPPFIAKLNDEQHGINVEYKPMKHFHMEQPGHNLQGQHFPFSSTLNLAGMRPETASAHNIVNKLERKPSISLGCKPEIATEQTTQHDKLTTSSSTIKPSPSISLSYKPMRPFYAGQSEVVTQGQINLGNKFQGTTALPGIVDRLDDKQHKPSINLAYKPIRPFHAGQFGNTLSVNPAITNKPQPIQPELEDRFNKPTVNTIVPTTTKSLVGTSPSLEYKPTRPSLHPYPGINIGPMMSQEQPLPDRPQPSLANKNQETITTPNMETLSTVNAATIKTTTLKISTISKIQATSSLDYQPNRPFYHPNPGNNVAQIVPPGQPWPASQEGYENFSQTTSFRPRLNLENRIEVNTNTTPTSSFVQNQDQAISLEYVPNRPSFHPNPGDKIKPIVPPGQPWPASQEGYESFSQTTSFRPGPSLENRVEVNTSTTPTSSFVQNQDQAISLEYVPNRPSFHPNPGDKIKPIVPPGQLWPASQEGYESFSQTTSLRPRPNLENRIEVSTITTSSTAPGQSQGQTINLEYKPNRPGFHPNPGDKIGQIVQPGQLGPSSIEAYQNFSQPSSTITESGFVWEEDLITTKPSPKPSPLDIADRFEANSTTQPAPINLEYNPQRPFHHSKPGQTSLSQIVRPGKPWPASPQGYQNFSQTQSNFENRVKEEKTNDNFTVTEGTRSPGLSLDTNMLHTSPPRVAPKVATSKSN